MPKNDGGLKEIHIEATPEAPYLQAARNAKIMGRCLLGAFLCIFALCILIAVLLPLKEKEIVVVEFKNGTNNVVVLEKADKNLQANDKLLSSMLRIYVSDRESVDKITEASIRYPRVRDMSSNEVWMQFHSVYGNAEVGPFFQKGLKRAIQIITDAKLADGIHQIEFQRTDQIDGQPGEAVSKWVATIRYVFVDRKVTEAEALRNPMGLIVTEYSVKARQE